MTKAINQVLIPVPEVNMLSLIEKAEEMGLTDFVKAIKTLKLINQFEKGNFTVFIPQNGAFTLDNDLLDSGAGIILQVSFSVYLCAYIFSVCSLCGTVIYTLVLYQLRHLLLIVT